MHSLVDQKSVHGIILVEKRVQPSDKRQNYDGCDGRVGCHTLHEVFKKENTRDFFPRPIFVIPIPILFFPRPDFSIPILRLPKLRPRCHILVDTDVDALVTSNSSTRSFTRRTLYFVGVLGFCLA